MEASDVKLSFVFSLDPVSPKKSEIHLSDLFSLATAISPCCKEGPSGKDSEDVGV